MDSKKVSIITVSYNSVNTIKDTIESIGKQTYKDVEYIVVDGGSTDGTIGIVEEYDSVVDRWISGPDEGIYDAMNKGIKMSEGDVIGILNSDDWYEPETVQKVVRVFQEEDNLGLVHGAMRLWSEEGAVDGCYGAKDSLSPVYTAPFNHPTCFVRRDVYDDIGLFDVSLSTAADYDFMLRFIRSKYEARYIDQVLTNFRQGGTTSQMTGSAYRQIWRVLRRHNYSLLRVLEAVGFRLLRDIAAYGTDNLLPLPVQRELRRWLPYHRSTSE